MTTTNGHFHDYYSRTYQRYESYTSTEREQDLYTMMDTISRNNNKIFQSQLYYGPDGNINPVFKQNVLCAVGDQISTTLSGPIIQEITMVLSSPEAAVALSAPVVNLITTSKEIHTQTVNVVGSAISSGEYDQQLKTPVTNVIKTEEVKTVIVNNVGDAISSNTLSNQMFTATEYTLKNPEISSSMITPVANVIPTSQVSSTVVEVAAAGITIEKIVGNQGENFKDKNKNGIPDEYENLPDEDEEDNDNTRTPRDTTLNFVFGDLGA